MMLLNELKIPKTKNELVKKLQTLKQLKFEIIDDVKRIDVLKIRNDMEKFIGNDEVCIILLKSK